MENFFRNLKNRLCRFMYGRNGTDQLNQALLFVYVAVWVLGMLITKITNSQLLSTVFGVINGALAWVLLWRTFSKNLTKRRGENAKFLTWWNPIRRQAMNRVAQKQDKSHKYFTCKNCRTVCRVPAGKGKIEITCPKCGAKIRGKS